MADNTSHYGDDDPEHHDDDLPDYQEQLFETASYLGWTPDSMHDEAFAAKYKEWLARQP